MKVKNGLIMAAIPAAIFVQNAEAAKTPNRPNVIFILMDDAGGCKEDLDNRQTVPHTFLTAGFQS